jgi:hypothetical protein
LNAVEPVPYYRKLKKKKWLSPWENLFGWLYFIAFFRGTIPAASSFGHNEAGDDPAQYKRENHLRLP